MLNRLKLFPAILLIFLFLGNLYSQNNNDSSNVEFKFPKYSFQFRINDFLEFSTFDGSTISIKYHLTNKSSIRMGISVFSSDEEREETLKNLPQDSIYNKWSSKYHQKLFSMRLLYLYYFNPQEEIKAFIGFGPKLGFRKNSRKYDDYYGEKYNIKDWIFGISSVYGVEWFFRQNMSLILSYGIEYTYESYESKDEYSDEKRINKITQYLLDDTQIDFGLSLYFNP
jgi:opacity protein-like surface antigen